MMLLQQSSLHDPALSSSFDRSYARVRRRDIDDIFGPASIPAASMASTSRKRPRISTDHNTSSQTPRIASSSYGVSNSIASLDAGSPSPLVNTDYFLSGGLDTPGAWSVQKLERIGERDAELDHRQNRFTTRLADASDSTTLKAPSSGEMFGASRTGENGWAIGRTAWALTGGLAGKIFNFCWNTTFRGFRAGGGQAYTDYAQAVTQESPGNAVKSRNLQHIPGSYPGMRKPLDTRGMNDQEDVHQEISVSCDRHIPEDPCTRNNWVFIERSRLDHRDQSPVRKKPRASVAGSGRVEWPQPYHSPRVNTAAFTSPRSRTSSHAFHPRQHSASKRSRASLASPSSRRQSSLHAVRHSPISPDIEQYQKKKRKEDRKQDESMRRLNAQLQDMIREGQQALGSKIEIFDDYDMDEGYFDDEMG